MPVERRVGAAGTDRDGSELCSDETWAELVDGPDSDGPPITVYRLMRAVENILPNERSSPHPAAACATNAAPVVACRVVTTSQSARLLLAGQLKAFNNIVWSVVSGDDGLSAPEGVEATYRIPMRRDLSVSDVRSFVRLLRFFRAHRFRFVQTHTPKASLLALPAARAARTPALYTMHGSLFFRDNSVRENVAPWVFERWCCMWANAVLVQSSEDAGLLPKVGICPRKKIVHIGNGIDLTRFSHAPYPPVGDGKPTVLMIGRLVAEKGTRDFFHVAKALHDKARFVHVGPREHDQRDAIPEGELSEVATNGHVEFVGEVDDVRPHIARAHLVLLPSFREGIPRAAMEAAALGRPVAGYDIRGLREVVPPELGLLVRRRDVQALAELVGRLLEDPQRLASLGHACREAVVSHFSEAVVIERLRDVYARFGAP